MLIKFLIFYLVFINIFAVAITIRDKRSAIKGRRRIREKTLFTVAILGGSIGMFATMQIIRHKTKHISFMLGIPFIFICQCLFAFFLARIFGVV